MTVLSIGQMWGATATLDGSCIISNAQSYQDGPATLTDKNGNEWKVAGYGATANTNVVIGKGGANYLETPEFSGNISSIAVTWSGNTSYYLALKTTSGTELEAKQNPSSATEQTFNVTGEYKQLQLVGRRSSGTSNAAATITKVVVTYAGDEQAPASYTFDLSKKTYTTGTNEVTWSCDYVTVHNSGTNATNYLGGDANNRTSSRFYSGNSLIITPSSGLSISSVVFTAATDNHATILQNSTWTNATASVDGSTVTVTPTNGANAMSATVGGTCGFTSVVVNFASSGSGSQEPTLFLNPSLSQHNSL